MNSDDREPVLAQAVAGRLMAGVPLMGGTLALTATRLVFLPLVSRAGLGILNKAAKLSERAHASWTSSGSVVSVCSTLRSNRWRYGSRSH